MDIEISFPWCLFCLLFQVTNGPLPSALKKYIFQRSERVKKEHLNLKINYCVATLDTFETVVE